MATLPRPAASMRVTPAARRVPRRSRSRIGFTLIEMLVVITIIAMLMAMTVQGIQQVRELGRQTSCGNNLHQIAVAAIAHSARLGHFPTGGWDGSSLPTAGGGSGSKQPGGWCYAILPDLDMQAAYDSMSTSAPVPTFACASRRGSSLGPGSIGVMTDYAGNRGSWSDPAGSQTTTFGWNVGSVSGSPSDDAFDWQTVANTLNTPQPIAGTGASVPTGGVIFAGSTLPPARIKDGNEKTYLCAEKYVPRTEYESGAWSGYNRCAFAGDSPDTLRAGHRLPASDATANAAGMEGGFGGPHPRVFLAAMCDGSVKVIRLDDLDAAVHFLLAARADLQVVQVPE